MVNTCKWWVRWIIMSVTGHTCFKQDLKTFYLWDLLRDWVQAYRWNKELKKLFIWKILLERLLFLDTFSLHSKKFKKIIKWSFSIVLDQCALPGGPLSLFFNFHRDLESKWAIREPRKSTQLASTLRRVIALHCFYCKLAQFEIIESFWFLKGGETL